MTAAAHPKAAPAPVELYLEVDLNRQPTGKIAAFRQEADGTFSILAAGLTELGILTEPSDADAEGRVVLDRLPGLTYAYDEAAQAIAITVAVARLPAREYDAGHKPDAGAGDGTPLSGLAMNYTLYGTIGSDTGGTVSAFADAWLFGPKGILAQSAIVRASDDWDSSAIRLDTTWTVSNPESLRTWRAGDIITGGLAWSRPVRLGGIQVERNFALRPDLVTAPLPSYSGSAAVPSTVEVYANGARLYSGDVAAGPFTISDLPIANGAGTARVVLRDSLGRTTETDLPFFASTALLRKGLSDFSVEAGFPRRGFGVDSFGYAPVPAIAATLRHGLTDTVTVEAHGEATPTLVNGGAGVVAAIANRGLVSAALAGSLGARNGLQGTFSAEWHFDRATLRLRATHSLGDYADIGAVTALGGFSGAAPRAIDQVSLSLPFGEHGTIAGALAYTDTGDEQLTLATLTYSRRLGRANVYATGYYAPARGDAGFFVGLSRSFDNGVSASTRFSHDRDGISGRAEIARGEKPTPGSIGWRLAADIGERQQWFAGASLRGSKAHYAATARGDAHTVTASGEVRGAVVAAAGDVFLAERIDDAFAIVDAGSPGVTVFAENREVGRTNANGRILVPRLRAWEPNRISIDPDELALDMAVDRAAATARPASGGALLIDFAPRSIAGSAMVILRRPNGAFPPPGTPGRLNDATDFIVGYDGQAYLEDLAADNRLALDLAGDSTCTARFAFAPGAGAQPVIDGVVCE